MGRQTPSKGMGWQRDWMRSRRRRTSWAFVTLLALSWLAVSGAIAAHALQAPPDGAPTLVIPSGRLGDVATYEVYAQYNWTFGDGGGRIDEDTQTVQMSGVENVTDMNGNRHTAVRVHIAGGDFNDGTTHQRTEYFDVETRDVIKVVTDSQEPDGTVGALVWFGPRFHDPPNGDYSGYRFSFENHTWGRYHGRTFTFGEDLGLQRASELIAYAPAKGSDRVEAASSRVDRVGTYRGQTVLGITETWDLLDRALNPTVGDLRMVSNTTIWLSAEHPYPVLIEERSWATSSVARDDWYRVHRLVGYEQGDGAPLPWGPEEIVPAPEPERSKGSVWRPDQGSGSRFPIDLDDATDRLVQDPALAGFASWRQRNDGWQVVGVDLRSGIVLGFNDLPGYQLEMTYAAPLGETAYRVRSNYLDPSQRPINDKPREFALQAAGGDHRLPGRGPNIAPITLAEMDRDWQMVGRPESTNLGPNRLVWGYAKFDECDEGGRVVACGPWKADYALSHAQFGWNRGLYALPQEAAVTGFEWDLIDLDITEDRLILGKQVRVPWSVAPPLLSGQTGNVRPVEPPVLSDISRLPATLLAVTAGAAILAALAYAYNILKFGLTHAWLQAGFTRIRDDDVLAQKRRRAIVDCIQQDPGLNATEVHERVGGGWSTVIYHLSVLKKRGAIMSLPDGRHRRFFPATGLSEERGAIAALRNDRTRVVHEAIREHPGIGRQALAKTFGMSVPGVLWHVDRLTRGGLVEATPAGRKFVYHAKTTPAKALYA